MDLIFLKIVSDALTAASGLLGLLTEFKDKHHQITRNGKVALIGIVAGFLVSALISVRESINSKRQDAAIVSDISAAYNKGKTEMMATYEKESRRIQLPLNHLHVQLHAASAFNSTQWEKNVRNYLHNNMRGPVAMKDLPYGLRKDHEARELHLPEMMFSIFKPGSASTCNGIRNSPDLSLTKAIGKASPGDNSELILELMDYTYNLVELTTDYDLRVEKSSQAITSTDDLRGAVLWARQGENVGPEDLSLFQAKLTMGEGKTYTAALRPFSPGATATLNGYSGSLAWRGNYCYKFDEGD
jgi:hypothetical protein